MLRALILCLWTLCSAAAQEGLNLTRSSTPTERLVVLEMSKARLHPREYARWLRTQLQYFDGSRWNLPGREPIQTQEGAAPLEELIKFLEHAFSIGPLSWKEGLHQAARQLILEQGPTGQTGHKGQDGSTLQSRVLKFGLHQSMIGEVINYGPNYGPGQPRWTVVQLLIDDGVPNRGHRNAIFNPAFHVAGAAIGPHAVYGEMTVVDLADGFMEN